MGVHGWKARRSHWQLLDLVPSDLSLRRQLLRIAESSRGDSKWPARSPHRRESDEGPNAKRRMLGNREMVLTMLIGRQSKVTTGLTACHCGFTDRSRGSLIRHNFLADMVKAETLGACPSSKSTANRFTDFSRQFSQGVRFCEDRLPECTRNVPALRSLSTTKINSLMAISHRSSCSSIGSPAQPSMSSLQRLSPGALRALHLPST